MARRRARRSTGPSARVVYALNKPLGVLSHRQRHPRPPDGRRARGRRAGARLYPVGRLDADTDRADPAHQRRRARQPADAPALSRCPRPTARRLAGGPVGEPALRRAARRASSSRTARPRPPSVRRSRPARCWRSRSAKAATARCGACARRSAIPCSSWSGSRFGPLRLGRPGARAQHRRLQRGGARSACAALRASDRIAADATPVRPARRHQRRAQRRRRRSSRRRPS